MISPKVPTDIKHQIHVLTQMHPSIGVSRYLGVPIFSRPLNKYNFLFLEEKMATRIQSGIWKFLSMVDRNTLLKAMLIFIPIYYLSYIHVLASVINNLEKEFRTFLWRHSSDKHGLHLIVW